MGNNTPCFLKDIEDHNHMKIKNIILRLSEKEFKLLESEKNRLSMKWEVFIMYKCLLPEVKRVNSSS